MSGPATPTPARAASRSCPVRLPARHWAGVGVGGYPTIEGFQFGQEVFFTHVGKPYLAYESRSWRLDADGNRVAPGRPGERLLARPAGRFARGDAGPPDRHCGDLAR